MTGHKIITPAVLPDSAEVFRLDDNCEGVIWQSGEGWSGCLKWDIEGNTDFVGPFNSKIQATTAVRNEFVHAAITTLLQADPD